MNTPSDAHFDPSEEHLDRLMAEVSQSVGDGCWPLAVIDHVGIPYFVQASGYDYEVYPWGDAIDRFVAIDEEHRIHWVHPALLERIAAIKPEDFWFELDHSGLIEGLTRLESTHVLDEHCLLALLRLMGRQEVTAPLYARLQELEAMATPQMAQEVLEACFRQAGVGEDLGWSLAQVALKVHRSSSAINPHLCSITRASILARLVDCASCPAPDAAEARRALVTLRVTRQPDPSAEVDEIQTLAAAIAHDLLDPIALEGDQGLETDQLLARISRGDFDPAASTVVWEDPRSSMHWAIADHLTSNGGLSSHQAIKVVDVANRRLAEIGHDVGVDFAACTKMAAEGADIPF